MNYYKQFAQKLLTLGYEPLALKGKRPFQKEWAKMPVNADTVHPNSTGMYDDLNIGIRLGKVRAIDVDVTDEPVAKAVFKKLQKMFPGEQLMVRFGAHPKFLVLFRSEDPAARKHTGRKVYDLKGSKHLLEVLGAGNQCVVFGMHPDTGDEYKWMLGNTPVSTDAGPEQLPVLSRAQEDQLFSWFEGFTADRGWKSSPSSETSDTSKQGEDVKLPVDGLTIERAIDLLKELRPHKREEWDGYDGWLKVGMALHHQFKGTREGLSVWDLVSQQSVNYNYDELVEKWASFDKGRPGGVTMRTLMHEAEQLGVWTRPPGVEGGPIDAGEFPDIDGEDEESKPATSERLTHTVEDVEGTAPPDSIIHGLVGVHQTMAIAGMPKTGKSVLALEMARCVSAGEEFAGMPVHNPGPVLYLAYEGVGVTDRRLMAIKAAHGHESTDRIYVARPTQSLTVKNPHKEVIGPLMNEVKRIDGQWPVLVVVDTVAAATGEMDENTMGGMGAFVTAMRTIVSHYRAAICYIHHYAKGTDTMRGHSSLQADLDCFIKVALEDNGQRRATVAEQRWFAEPANDFLYRTVSGLTGWQSEDEEPETQAMIEWIADAVEDSLTHDTYTVTLRNLLDEWFEGRTGTVLEGSEYNSLIGRWKDMNRLEDMEERKRSRIKKRAGSALEKAGIIEIERDNGNKWKSIKLGKSYIHLTRPDTT